MPWSGPLFEGHICSIGYEVLDWIHEYCCHGPGDVQGEPLDYDDEIRDFVIECYRLDPFTGRRTYSEAVLSRPKGRALALDTPVPTPSGWTTMGSVEVGDTVFSETGQPIKVVNAFATLDGRDCYRVTFSDGESIVADADHLWHVEELRREYRAHVVDTAYLARYRTTRSDGAANFRLHMPQALNLPAVDLPVDPYVLGYWLGDGRTDDAEFTLHVNDVPSFAAQVAEAGYHLGRLKPGGSSGAGTTVAVRVSTQPIRLGGNSARDSLGGRLRALGVLGAKHIPTRYLRSSCAQRLALLQGLVDSDGCIGRDGRTSVTTTKAGLRDGLVELVATLGIKSATREFTPRLNGRDIGVAWKVEFWAPSEVPVARLPRKACRQRPAGSNSLRKSKAPRGRLADTRRIMAVERVPSVPVRCIAVDNPTGLFLAGRRMVQTHNSKSEIAGVITVAEAFAEVRFDGWNASGQPVARPVTSPLVKCLATEESQAGNTFQVAAFVAGEWGPDAHPDVFGGASGVRKYQSASALYVPGGGEIRACTSGSASKDGGRESFVVPDESHLYVLPELRKMYATVMRNLPKRKLAQPWALQTTTAYRPGEQSIAEQTLTAWRKGELSARVYVDHREAKGPVRIRDRAHTIAQLRQVYGAAMDPHTGWMDPSEVYETMLNPTICPDDETAARYYLNRPLSNRDAWIAKDVHERQIRRGDVVEAGEPITIGFDGSLNEDTTVLRGCRISDGFRFRLGAWPKPEGPAAIGWEVPRRDVLATIDEAFERYTVVRGYFDPHEWRTDIDTLAEKHGEDRVIKWATTRDIAMAAALDRLHADLMNGATWHDDDPLAHDHYGNAYVRWKGKLRLVRKEYPNSPRKIDTVVGDALAYEARADVLASGWTAEPPDTRVIFMRR